MILRCPVWNWMRYPWRISGPAGHAEVASNILLPAMWLTGCNILFSHSSALALWTNFAHLVDLDIWNCDTLVYWPENVWYA
jgi:hypothetical protein